MESEYGSWLTEDLKDYHDRLLRERNRSEVYSDRAEINQIIKLILSEIKLRERN
jgi:hypothetical protein